MTVVRWTMTDRGFRHYAEVEGHGVHESSAAEAPHLWVDGEHLDLTQAAQLRDRQSPGAWRDTLSEAIDGHYQVRVKPTDWGTGSVCDLCGSRETLLINDVASCNGCGASEGDA